MPGSMRLKMRGGKEVKLPGFKKGDVVCGAANRRRARQGANVNKK